MKLPGFPGTPVLTGKSIPPARDLAKAPVLTAKSYHTTALEVHPNFPSGKGRVPGPAVHILQWASREYPPDQSAVICEDPLFPAECPSLSGGRAGKAGILTANRAVRDAGENFPLILTKFVVKYPAGWYIIVTYNDQGRCLKTGRPSGSCDGGGEIPGAAPLYGYVARRVPRPRTGKGDPS